MTTQKTNYDQTQNLNWKNSNSNCDKTTKLKKQQNSNCDYTQNSKLKLYKNSNSNKTQKLKYQQNLKTPVLITLKKLKL